MYRYCWIGCTCCIYAIERRFLMDWLNLLYLRYRETLFDGLVVPVASTL